MVDPCVVPLLESCQAPLKLLGRSAPVMRCASVAPVGPHLLAPVPVLLSEVAGTVDLCRADWGGFVAPIGCPRGLVPETIEVARPVAGFCLVAMPACRAASLAALRFRKLHSG